MPTRFAAISVLCFALLTSAYSQAPTGGIAGRVLDRDGHPIASAPVQAKNAQSGSVYHAKTSADGSFTLSQLPAGGYEVFIAISGFERKNSTVENLERRHRAH